MKSQRGGFFMGMIVGLLAGLAVALGVALYVTKVPVPFVDKVPQHTAQQDAAEAERNKSWNPNAALGSKAPVRPPPTAAETPAAKADARPEGKTEAKAETRDETREAPKEEPLVAKAEPAAPKSAASAASAARSAGPDPFLYFVQVGAFAQSGDAEQQRARVGLTGLTAKVTEREQSGRTVYRVRVGPLDSRDAAEKVKEQVVSAGLSEATLVRVPRN